MPEIWKGVYITVSVLPTAARLILEKVRFKLGFHPSG